MGKDIQNLVVEVDPEQLHTGTKEEVKPQPFLARIKVGFRHKNASREAIDFGPSDDF